MKDEEKATGTEQYAAFMKRLLASYGRKAQAGELDVTALVQLAEIRDMLDEQIRATVTALRSEEGGAASWTEIGAALGMHRGAAQKKFAATGARAVGGQPAHLR